MSTLSPVVVNTVVAVNVAAPGELPVPLDCFFANIRSKETNSGNLVADLCRESTKADVAIINSGTIRSDRIMGPGHFTMRDLLAFLPLDDAIVLLGSCLAVVYLRAHTHFALARTHTHMSHISHISHTHI